MITITPLLKSGFCATVRLVHAVSGTWSGSTEVCGSDTAEGPWIAGVGNTPSEALDNAFLKLGRELYTRREARTAEK